MMVTDQTSHGAAELKGFDTPVHDAQSAFRICLDALARPATIRAMSGPASAPAPLYAPAAAILLALADFETPVWLDAPAKQSAPLLSYLRFNTAAPIVDDPASAAFALITDPAGMPGLDMFAKGDALFPDRSATLIIQVAEMTEAGTGYRGPGIQGVAQWSAAPLPASFDVQLDANRQLFPCGVDFFFATETHIAALPRSVRRVGEVG